ncbi:MAG: hypothetical protein HOY78_02415 [Saccharothrix sp.]|nr:hypothetical protein [Saccharothrix sp.]
MNTFDGTGLDGRTGALDQLQPTAPPYESYGEPVQVAEFDSLALLREAVAQQVEVQPVVVEAPGNVGVRLVCHTDVTSKQLQKWQRLALPPALRKSPNPPALAMDQLQLNVAVLSGTMLRVEVRDRQTGAWVSVQDRAGNELTFNDTALLEQFGALDTVTALKRLFVQESEIVKAGQAVLAKAGWTDREMVTDDLNEDSDPT